jgi:CRISPR type I-E-associated protein CasB/Cse2
MARIAKRGLWLWEELDLKEPRARATLATLRAGVNRQPGDVSELWRHYRVVVPDDVAARGEIHKDLQAEHTALTLFGLHQQSQDKPMHKAGSPLGTSLRALRASKQFKDNPDALDKRVNAAAATESARELGIHLRALVKLLRDQQIPLDYTDLVRDLADWHFPDTRARVRRRWGAQYYVWASRDGDEAGEQADSADTPALDSAAPSAS